VFIVISTNHVWSRFSSVSKNLIFTQLWPQNTKHNNTTHTKPLFKTFCPLLVSLIEKLFEQTTSFLLLHRLWAMTTQDQINVHLNPKPPIDPIVPKP
jgi:hypothetical protein